MNDGGSYIVFLLNFWSCNCYVSDFPSVVDILLISVLWIILRIATPPLTARYCFLPAFLGCRLDCCVYTQIICIFSCTKNHLSHRDFDFLTVSIQRKTRRISYWFSKLWFFIIKGNRLLNAKRYVERLDVSLRKVLGRVCFPV